ncbi:MAG: hypothetical protein AAFV95_28360 [Bacteroidota bacterium]
MNKSKLIEILSALSQGEMQRLQAFLQSPYFQQAAMAVDEWRLFELLQKAHPDFASARLDKEFVFRQLYPTGAFVKGKLEKKMSALIRKIEQFMVVEEQARQTDEFTSLLHRTTFYRRKKLQRLYDIHLAQLQKWQAELSTREPEDYLHEFLLQKEISTSRRLSGLRKKDLNLVSQSQALDEYYLIEKLICSCALLSQLSFQHQIDLQDSLQFLDGILLLRDSERHEQHPLIHTYSQVYSLFRNMQDKEADQPAAYLELESLLERYEDQLPFQTRQAFHAFCRSFYTRQYNRGQTQLKDKLFELYRHHLSKGYLFHQGGLTPGVFKNIVWISLIVGAHEWVKQFLDDHKDRIVGTAHPHDVYQLNLANYYFHRQQYDESLNHLKDTYEDFFYQLAAKRLRIKIYFENQSDLLDSQINAFRLYLRRLSKGKLPELARQSNNAFINMLKQIRLPRTHNNPRRIQSLQQKIRQIEVIKEKEWLLEKLRG